MTLNDFISKYFLNRTLINYLLVPFSLIVCFISFFRRLIYRTAIIPYKAPVQIISVGNIILGGSGKTPFTIYLAELLTQQGWKTAISHRGYKSALEKSETLISNRDGLLPEADKAGDEAWLLAKRLRGIPVVVGKNRKLAVQLMAKTFPDLDCIILDDSFQHLKVKHDLDIIIVSARLGFGNGFVLPAGYLREPVSVLKHCDLIALNKSDGESISPRLSAQISKAGKVTITGKISLDLLYDFNGKEIELNAVKQDKLLLLTAIGNPNSFENLAAEQGLQIAGKLLYIDHYSYSDRISRKRILAMKDKLDAHWIITTEKDYAKLRQYNEYKDCLLVAKVSFVPSEAEAELLSLLKEKMSKINN